MLNLFRNGAVGFIDWLGPFCGLSVEQHCSYTIIFGAPNRPAQPIKGFSLSCGDGYSVAATAFLLSSSSFSSSLAVRPLLPSSITTFLSVPVNLNGILAS